MMVAAFAAVAALALIAPSWTSQDTVPEDPIAAPTLEENQLALPAAEPSLADVPEGRRTEPSGESPAGATRSEPEPERQSSSRASLSRGPMPWPRPLMPPRPGNVRIRGTLHWDEDEGSPDFTHARVRFFEAHGDWTEIPLGEVAPTASGTFSIDTAMPEPTREAKGAQPNISWVALVPGYDIVEGSISMRHPSGAVIEVEGSMSRYGALMTGRVTLSNGKPVEGALVHYIDWAQSGQDADQNDFVTRADGTFEVHAGDGGWFDAVISHASYGQAKVTVELPVDAVVHHFGDIVLAERLGIDGTLRGFGEYALPFMRVHLTPVDPRFEGAALVTTADRSGRFKFVALADVPYFLSTDLSEERMVVRPGSSGVDLRVGLPSAHLTIEGAILAFLDSGELVVQSIDPAGGQLIPVKNASKARIMRDETGLAAIIFRSPGCYSIGAYVNVRSARWSAVKVIDIGLEHLEVDLHLKPETGPKVQFEVTGPDMASINQWTATIEDARTGVPFGTVDSSMTTAKVPPGTWNIRVVPGGDSFVLPKTVQFRIDEHAAGTVQVPLELGDIGGRLEIGILVPSRIKDQARRGLRAELDIQNSRSKRIARPSLWPWDGTLQSFKRPVRPGRYHLSVTCMDANHQVKGKASKDVDVVAGESSEVTLVVKEKK